MASLKRSASWTEQDPPQYRERNDIELANMGGPAENIAFHKTGSTMAAPGGYQDYHPNAPHDPSFQLTCNDRLRDKPLRRKTLVAVWHIGCLYAVALLLLALSALFGGLLLARRSAPVCAELVNVMTSPGSSFTSPATTTLTATNIVTETLRRITSTSSTFSPKVVTVTSDQTATVKQTVELTVTQTESLQTTIDSTVTVSHTVQFTVTQSEPKQTANPNDTSEIAEVEEVKSTSSVRGVPTNSWSVPVVVVTPPTPVVTSVLMLTTTLQQSTPPPVTLTTIILATSKQD